jgi:hypothetical protein
VNPRMLAAIPLLLLSISCKKDAAPASTDAPVASGGICPAGSAGKGTPSEPCSGPGRLLEAKWTGKTGSHSSVFTVKNNLPYKVTYVSAVGYYYDKDGKQLEVALPGQEKFPHKVWAGSGGVLTIEGSQTKDIELGWKKETIPKEAETIEIEFGRVGWKKDGSDALIYWENKALTKNPRPKGGHKS